MTPAQLLESAVSLALQAAVVIAAAQMFARGLQTDRARDRLWNACLLALLALPLAAFLLPHARWISGSSIRSAVGLAPGFPWEAAAARWLLRVWCVGAAFLTLRLVLNVVRLKQLVLGAKPLAKELAARLTERLALDQGVPAADSLRVNGRSVELLVSETLHSPACWQFQQPCVMLPASLAPFPPEELSLIVRHELVHLRSGHPLLLFVQRLVEIVFWMHPAVWWASRQSQRAREMCCDEASATSRPEAARYVRALLRLATTSSPAGSTALGFGAERSQLVERVERLASRDWMSPAPIDARWKSAAPWAGALAATLLLWAPLDAEASRRSLWSPWPGWSAAVLQSLGVSVRDYEVDGHRLRPQEFRAAVRKTE